LTTAQLVGSLAASAKNALDLAKASSDHALKGAVSELYDSLLDVKGRVLDLDEENRRLKTELARKDEFIGPIEPHGYFFYKEKPDQPLCPRCFQSQPQHPVYLSPLTDFKGGQHRSCIICGYDNYETPRKSSSDPVMGGRSSLFHQSRGYM
jgi:hypothetical protein